MASDGSVVILIEGDDEQFESTLKGLGETAKTAAKSVAAVFTAATASVAALTKNALDSYAAFEQLAGGVETLFGTRGAKTVEEYATLVGQSVDYVAAEYEMLQQAQADVMRNASNAYKTAGLSANAYMETVTSIAAALKQSTASELEAAEYADRAITDMADNANKMGTALESIQFAYQGFAKQNYTMLDNLKLGYGGTKTEMERLLEDAKELSGIEYDISSYADIVDAIHVMQVELGIAGATAAEAESTIEGSLASMSAAWQNLVTGIADEEQDLDQLIDNFVNSVGIAADNVLPRVEIILGGIGDLIAKLAPTIAQAVPDIVTQVVPGLVQAARSLVQALGQALIQNVPQLLTTAVSMVTSLRGYLMQQAPLLMEAALSLMSSLSAYLQENLPSLIETGLQMVSGLSASLLENASLLIDGAIGLILALGQGLIDSLPSLIEYVPEIVSNIANIINDNAPKLLVAAGTLIVELGKGLIDAIPDLVANIPEIIAAIVDVWTAFNWLDLGTKAITAVKDGALKMVGAVKTAGEKVTTTLVNAIKNLPTTLANIGRNGITGLANAVRNLAGTARTAMQTVVTGIVNTITGLPNKMLDIGKNIVQGIARGIANGASAAVNAVADLAQRVLNKAKSALGIASPSRVMRDEVGAMLPPGIGKGVEKTLPDLERAVRHDMEALSAKMRDAVQAEVLTVSAQLSGGTTGKPVHDPQPNPTQTNIINVTVKGGTNETEARNVGREIGRETVREMRRRGLIMA